MKIVGAEKANIVMLWYGSELIHLSYTWKVSHSDKTGPHAIWAGSKVTQISSGVNTYVYIYTDWLEKVWNRRS